MLKKELKALGFTYDVAELLSRLFSYREAVPQGSPVSGDALNLFMWRVDHLMASEAGRLGVKYTRLADDFVFSSKEKELAPEVICRLEGELAIRGMSVNDEKKRRSGFQTPSDQRLVHGISVCRRRGTKIRKEQVKTALALADRYLSACKSVTADSIQAVAALRARLFGWCSYCSQAHYGPVKCLRQKLRAGDRHVARKLDRVGIHSKKNKWWAVDWKNNRNEPRRIATIWRKRLAKALQIT